MLNGVVALLQKKYKKISYSFENHKFNKVFLYLFCTCGYATRTSEIICIERRTKRRVSKNFCKKFNKPPIQTFAHCSHLPKCPTTNKWVARSWSACVQTCGYDVSRSLKIVVWIKWVIFFFKSFYRILG